jgi:hypothetical protein
LKKLPSENEKSLSWIKRYTLPTVEGVKIDYGDEGKD